MTTDKGRRVPDHASGPLTSPPRPKQYWLADPDETEGRAKYRAQANGRARLDVSMARRNPTLKTPSGDNA